MSFKGFLKNALGNSNNYSDVQLVAPTTDIDAALRSIGSFVNGAMSMIEFTSLIFVTGNAIEVSGRKNSERLQLHPGFYYFNDEDVIEDINAQDLQYYFPVDTATNYATMQCDRAALGWFFEFSATNQTDGQVSVTSTVDGVVVQRTFFVRNGETVGLFIPSRTHLVNESRTNSVTGTGTAVDPFVLDTVSDNIVDTNVGLMRPTLYGAPGEPSIEITYTNVYFGANMLPNRFSYLKNYFS